MKLRGRTEALDQRRGRTLSPSARGGKPQAHHGPLQRLLGAMVATKTFLHTLIEPFKVFHELVTGCFWTPTQHGHFHGPCPVLFVDGGSLHRGRVRWMAFWSKGPNNRVPVLCATDYCPAILC